MEFTLLSKSVQGAIVALSMASFIVLLVGLFANIMIKKDRRITVASGFLLLLTLIDTSILMALNGYIETAFYFKSHGISQLINRLPPGIHIVFALGTLFFSVHTMYRVYASGKNTINDFSIKEALESLPTGIAFLSDKAELYLSNHIMHDLSKELTGRDLMRGNDFWAQICAMKSNDNCVLGGDHPAFIVKGSRVWQFSRTLYKGQTGDYYEMRAVDITDLYMLSKNAQQVNTTLAMQQQQLQNLATIIEKNTEQQLAVDMKVNFHDNFGNLLALTKQTLRESHGIDDTKVLAHYWSQLTDIISNLANDKKEHLSLEQIVRLGEKLGCTIVLNGAIPTEDENSTLILLCMNEGLKNAYRHANARQLKVSITETQEVVRVTIHNETEKPLSAITPGGGLVGLRQRIERAGGQMKLSTQNGVTMDITLQKHHENGTPLYNYNDCG